MTENVPAIQIESNTLPSQHIERAEKVAGACVKMANDLAVEIQGNKYLPVEVWESIAIAHGCFAGARDVERVYDSQGELIGWKAIGEVRNNSGAVLAQGEGYVGKDEKRWGKADEYACRAMAQTRAISRACRGTFSHIATMMKIDNLKTTPAEEVPREGFNGERSAMGTCPDCGKAAVIKGKEEYGGGWLCWKQKGGCGAKFTTNPADGPVDATDAMGPREQRDQAINECQGYYTKLDSTTDELDAFIANLEVTDLAMLHKGADKLKGMFRDQEVKKGADLHND